MSSDSEDDCYGNIARRLHTMKSNYSEDKIETTNLLLKDLKEKSDNSWRKNDSLAVNKDSDVSLNSEIGEEEYSLDAIIAKNSKKRATRASKRNAVSVDNILPETTRSKRTKKSGPTQSVNDTQNNAQCTENDAQTSQSRNNQSLDSSVIEAARGRNRCRGRGRGTRRGRNTGRNSSRPPRNTSWTNDMNDPSLYNLAAAIAASTAMLSTGPVYSVGNTDEYPDLSDSQPLFNSSVTDTQNEVITLDNELDENEELSVKVYWQSSEHVKFNIRRFQKLTKIFKHFAERENVEQNKLLFTYNDKILKSNDTPDSINYSIVKFIDGGIVNKSVSNITKICENSGIKLKFQCQNVKKPIVMSIQPDEKMSVVMMKCSESLEQPLEKLKFYFDGDLISGKFTAKELEIEGGECIDVKIIS